MGNLNGPWTLGWTGKTTSTCSDIPLISHSNEIYRIFQVNPTGTLYISQETASSTDDFSVIQNFECGSGVVVRTINDSADVPGIIESAKSGSLILPRFPMEIEIEGLDGDYGDGNGVYSITTFFEENSPTYKSGTGWFIRRHSNGHWYIEHGIVGLGKLKGSDDDPTSGAYILEGCDHNCPRGRPSNPTSNQTPTPAPAPTPTPPSADSVTIATEHAEDTKIKLKWANNADVAVSSWEIQLTTLEGSSPSGTQPTLDWNKSTEFKFSSNQTSHLFENLTNSKLYYFRIRMITASGSVLPWVTTSANTTIPANTTNPAVTLTSSKIPKLTWTPLESDLQYLVTIEKSLTKTSWDVLQVISDMSVAEFKDETAVDEGSYYYRLIFKTGDFSGSPSDSMKVVVDRTAPNPPTLTPNDSNVDSNRLKFSWTTAENIKHFLYKFNSSSWINITEKSISIAGVEGENIFRLKSVDHSGNISTEVSQKINVDLTPPSPPILISPNPTVNETKQTYSWSNNSPDLSSYAYRLNLGVWEKLDKSTESITVELSQGLNTFEIKAIDHVKHESVISSSTVRVDSIPPEPPELSKIESDQSGTLTWTWSGPTDVEKYQYRFTTWNFNDDAIELEWVNLSKQVFEKSFDSVDGYNRFEIRAVDQMGNASSVASQTIALDLSPPSMPVLKAPTITNTGDDTYIVFSWELSSDTDRVRFRLNSESWFNEDSSVVTVTLNAKQDTNTFEIYALDAVGNKSETNRLDVYVDSIPPSPPTITGPIGECPSALWKQVWTACQHSMNNQVTTLKLTYSFIPKTTLLYAPFEPNTAKVSGVPAGEPSAPGMLFSDIASETHKAFQDWKQIIESAFENVTIEFENLGIETGNRMPSSPGVMYTPTNQGDIRIAFTSDVRATSDDRSFDNENPDTKTGVSDVYVDSSLNWKPDSSVDANSYSFRFGMRYYIGKSLGLEPNLNSTGTTHRIEKGKSAESVAPAEDISHFYNTYAYPTFLDTRSSLKVVKLNDLEVTWASDENVLFHWKYVHVGDQGEILTSSAWNTYSDVPTKLGVVKLDLDLASIPSPNIRFYVRSHDSRSNKSEDVYVDIKIVHQGQPTYINTVNKVCESNSDFKSGNNCWDKYGRFGCELGLSRVLENDESPLIIVKPQGYLYSLITEFETKSNLIYIDSLPPSTENEIRLVVRKYPEQFKYGFASATDYSAKLGTLFTHSSSVKTHTTDDSDIIPPPSVKINNPEHYRDRQSTESTTPIGEIRTDDQGYVPAAKLSWVTDIAFDLKENRIIYSDSVNFNNSKTIVVTDINQNSVTVPLEEYSTKYYFKIASYDESDNFSVSSTVSYTTVPVDHPPIHTEGMSFSTTGELVTRYNERPGYKWTIEFKLPLVLDGNYPSGHKIPDTDMSTRTDYSESDWMSLLGHLPFKVEVLNWPDTSPGSWTVLWVSRTAMHDVYLQSFSDIKPYIKDNRICFKSSGFNASTVYTVRFTAYDSSGHFVTQQYKFTTPDVDGDVTGPPPASLQITQKKFFNGYTTAGESLKDKQWVLAINWMIKETSDLAKFYLWYKEAGGEIVGGAVSLDKLSKVTDADTSRYSVNLSGFAPSTRYTFYTEAVDSKGNMSERTHTEITTAVGDTTAPEKPVMEDIRRWYHADYGDSLVFKVRPRRESELVLHIHVTTKLSETNMWKYEQKFYVPAENLKPDMYFVAKDIFKSGVVYKVAMAYTDSALNWSTSPFYWTTPDKPEIETSAEVPSFESYITWESQTNFSDVIVVS